MNLYVKCKKDYSKEMSELKEKLDC